MILWLLKNWQGLAVGIGLGLLAGGVTGYIKGREAVQISILKDTVKAHETRDKIEDSVSRSDDERLCLDLGGLLGDCAKLRRMEAPAKPK